MDDRNKCRMHMRYKEDMNTHVVSYENVLKKMIKCAHYDPIY